jgi:hypothetical protein
MVSLCDTRHWGHFNKFAKCVKMARVQRVKTIVENNTQFHVI